MRALYDPLILPAYYHTYILVTDIMSVVHIGYYEELWVAYSIHGSSSP